MVIVVPEDNGTVIYTAYVTLKNGKRIYARNYGLRAFRIHVKNAN